MSVSLLNTNRLQIKMITTNNIDIYIDLKDILRQHWQEIAREPVPKHKKYI